MLLLLGCCVVLVVVVAVLWAVTGSLPSAPPIPTPAAFSAQVLDLIPSTITVTVMADRVLVEADTAVFATEPAVVVFVSYDYRGAEAVLFPASAVSEPAAIEILCEIPLREIELEWSFEDYDLHLDLVLEPATEPEPYTFVYLGFGSHQGLHGTRTLVVR